MTKTLAIKLLGILGLLAVIVFLKLDNAKLETTIAKNEASYSAATRASAIELARKEAEVRKIEKNLRAQIDTLRISTNAEITNIESERTNLINRLHIAQRKARSMQLPTSTGDATVGTVTEGSNRSIVPQELGEQDINEAARADIIRVKYLECYAAYEFARSSTK